MGATGGSIAGINAVATVSAKTTTSPTERILACVDGSKIQLADDGAVTFSASDKAALEMNDDPTGAAGSPPNPTSLVPMWQTETIALKVIRYINFRRVVDTACTWMTVAY
jgi:hypothetical protein